MSDLRVPEALRRGLTFWRRSIQARVVVSTLLLSALVVTGVGWFLLRQVEQGLLSHRVTTVVAEASSESSDASKSLTAAPGTDLDATTQAGDLFTPIMDQGLTRGFSVVLADQGSGDTSIVNRGDLKTPGLDPSSVPGSLLRHFDNSTQSAWTYTTIRSKDADGRTVSTPGIVVGTLVKLPADGSKRTLYYLFPLDDLDQTLGLVTRALLTAAVLLLALIAALTFLLTRQIVTPIRLARRVAERLAAGQLQERLRVTG
jgi:two-component system sensor histidine kinase MtrB